MVDKYKPVLDDMPVPLIVCLNGPPRSGKDTAKDGLVGHFDSFWLPFAKPLKEGVHRFFHTPRQQWNAYESLKETPLPEFMGMTPREAYIWMAEDVMKRKWGQEYFGNLWLDALVQAYSAKYFVADDVIVITDNGFVEELRPLFRWLHRRKKLETHFLLVRLHREGCDFSNDSRSYVHFTADENPIKADRDLLLKVLGADRINIHDITNDGTVPELHKKIQKIVGDRLRVIRSI